jgi:hypothetical protein
MNHARIIGLLVIIYTGLTMGTLPHCSADIMPKKVRFHVRAGLAGTANEDGSISLRFNAAQWEKDQVGFRLLRRQRLKDDTWSEWYSVGPRIIAPDLTPARLAGMKLDTVQKEMPRWVKAGNPTTTDALVAKLSEAPKEYPGVLMIGFMNFQWAQALGHGYVDTTTKPNTLYEYAVAQIRKTPKGIIQDKPCATARLSSRHGDIECPAIERLSATYSRSKRAGIRIVWKTKPEKQKGTRQVVSWAILSGDPASPLKKVANRVPFSRDKDVHDYATSTSGDVTGKSIKIGIAPVDSFGTVGQIQATVVAAPRLAKVDRPESVTVSVKENAPPVVRWKHNTRIPFKGYRIRFFVQKKNSGLADEIKLEQKELIPAGRRYWVDTRDLSQYEGRTVQYQIVVVSGDYRSDIGGPLSRSQQIPFSDMPAPTSFDATVKTERGKRFVVCKWTGVKGRKSTYRVEYLLPEKKVWAEFLTSSTTEGKKDIGGTLGRTYVLRVIAINEEGKDSLPSDHVRVVIPDVNKISADNMRLSVEKGKDGSVQFYWTGPAWKHIAGYRLYCGNTLLSDEKTLTTYIRQFKMWDIAKGKHDYFIYAVDTTGRVSDTPAVPAGQKNKTPKDQE